MTTVYSKPACVQCEQTKKLLDRNGVEYTVVDITQDLQAYDKIVSMGFMSVPVVVSGDQSWAGFQPDKINSLSSEAA
jgi:glutaredoxin-like protein NrdH